MCIRDRNHDGRISQNNKAWAKTIPMPEDSGASRHCAYLVVDGDVYKRQEEWEKSPQFHEKVMERQEHQQEREQAFLSQNRDCFAIYQVSRDDPQNVRFMNLDWLKSHDISIDRSNYDLIYTAPLRELSLIHIL